MEAHPRSVRAWCATWDATARPEVCAHGRRISNLRDEGSGEHRDLQVSGHGGPPVGSCAASVRCRAMLTPRMATPVSSSPQQRCILHALVPVRKNPSACTTVLSGASVT